MAQKVLVAHPVVRIVVVATIVAHHGMIQMRRPHLPQCGELVTVQMKLDEPRELVVSIPAKAAPKLGQPVDPAIVPIQITAGRQHVRL
eukprot:CAMPEP_0198131272 /NCGR_PEP_ID=MMETSP1442-20131203/55800_1 /TAXON_ID= /ORGANISM="Craspedostauros australis, Strain CCMP3328" /LENGTH=87 /DNA_ID=CAMNT_0043792047 /DNA_START=133 /DNA_END=393 /DNA_ORIENTATION=-